MNIRKYTFSVRLTAREKRSIIKTVILSERREFRPAGKDTGSMNDLDEQARLAAERFAIPGRVTGLTRINKGYINRTFRVETLDEAGRTHRYLLQDRRAHV